MSKYLLITQESHTLPYAISFDADSLDVVTAEISDLAKDRLVFTPSLLIEADSGKAMRVFKDGADSWALSDTAFEKIGVLTPDEYFKEPETMEMDL